MAPKEPVADVDTKSLSLADLVAALKAATGNDDESMKKRAQYEAEAYERLEENENTKHPGISVFSYPEGDQIRPRILNCPTFWAGYDVQTDTTTAEEVELFNLAQPGVYKFQRTDKTWDTLTVTGERDAGGTLTKLDFTFLTEKDKLSTLPGIAAMLRSAFNVTSPEDQELDSLRRELDAMRTKLAAVPA